MEWVDGFGMWEMFEMNCLEESKDSVLLLRERSNIYGELDV